MTHTLDTPVPALEINDLSFRWGGADGYAIALPRYRIEPGEQALLTGGSGTGKSTLLQIIAGLIDPQGGRVMVAGKDMHAARGAARDRLRGGHIGMIFQTFNLLQGFSARENVLAALMFSGLARGEHMARATDLLRSLGIERMDGLVETLSVGQQQRAAVARAVACRPTLVLADEPTASLDPQNARAAIELIQATCRESGAALLCTSHDPAIRERFVRVDSVEILTQAAPAGATA